MTLTASARSPLICEKGLFGSFADPDSARSGPRSEATLGGQFTDPPPQRRRVTRVEGVERRLASHAVNGQNPVLHQPDPDPMLYISPQLSLPEREFEITGLRAAGPGGQHGDKAETAVHLRFDIQASSLPESCKQRLLAMPDQRISRDGIVVIKAQEHRSRDQNVASARERLCELIRKASTVAPVRRPTRPGLRARRRRTDHKKRRGHLKTLRKPPSE